MQVDSDRLLRIAEQHAAAAAGFAEVQRQNLQTLQTLDRNVAEHTSVLERMNAKLDAMEADRKEDRDHEHERMDTLERDRKADRLGEATDRAAAVASIQQRITDKMKGIRWAVVGIGIGIIISNLLGVPLGRLAEGLLHLK